jgi:hypothetical protein
MMRNPASVVILRGGMFFFAILCLAFACRNPFFPPTGEPEITPITPVYSLRATPSGIIQQLIQAYEQKDIDLYTDLFPKQKTFQFYVSPAFVATYQSRPYSSNFPPEPRDTMLHNIGTYPYYFYWGQDQEVRSHRNLLTNASVDAIQFTQQPNIQEIRYIVSDIDGKPDTANVEMLVTDGQIVISVNTGTSTEEYTIDIYRQVFLLERDASRLWVIRKWYDFGNQG